MNLAKEFAIAIGGDQHLIRINTDEIADCTDTLNRVVTKKEWNLRYWSKSKGLQALKGGKLISVAPVAANQPPPPGQPGYAAQPQGEHHFLAALKAVAAEKPQKVKGEYLPSITVFRNFHTALTERFREDASAILQDILQDRDENGESTGKFVVVLMTNEEKLPSELRPLFQVIDHPLPDEEELGELLDGVPDVPPKDEEDADMTRTKEERTRIIKAALGLTRMQAEGVFAASVVDSGKVTPTYVWQKKAQILNAEGLVTIKENTLSFKDVAGLIGCKQFLKGLMTHDPLDDVLPDARYRGVMLVGPPGTGKSLMAYSLGEEMGVPTIEANPGNLMGEFVGNTERNTRRFFQIIRRMAPCIVVMDEVEKTMPSGGGEGGSGGDIGKRMLGTFLTEMQNITEPVFWFFTSNDNEGMNPAFTRAERIDGTVYVRLPDEMQRAALWRMYLAKFFPKQIAEVDDKRFVNLDVKEAIKDFQRLRKVDVVDYGNKLAAALMGIIKGEDRDKFLKDIQKVDDNLYKTVTGFIIDDNGWTPAEIKACCRLMRRLRLTLPQISRRIPHVCLGSKGGSLLRRLDRWAVSIGALDAETGEQFVPIEERDNPEETPAYTAVEKAGKVKRKVRRSKDD